MSTTRISGAATLRPSRRASSRLAAILSIVGVLASASIVATGVAPAAATSYPSWNDVVAARNNQAAKAAEVTQITALITSLDAQVESTQADAQTKGDAYNAAEEAYFEAAARQQKLQQQADAAEAIRKKSETEAGQYAAQLARSGSNGLSLNLFLSGKNAGDLLDSLGNAGKVSERAEGIYKKAVQDKNTAQALTDQANVAAGILKNLKAVAQEAFLVAQKAADAAAAALQAQQTHKAELQAQLAALTTQLTLTQAQYLAGVQAEYGAGSGLVEISASGYARPAIGVITAGYGYRNDPAAGGAWRLHTGVDLAHGCNVPIYAAHSGTVIYAGWNGTLGNWILIDDGDGIQTGYGHIVDGGMYVHIGQRVGVGQNIAKTGETGGATGCHLHFEVRLGGIPVNPVPWMRGQGIVLG